MNLTPPPSIILTSFSTPVGFMCGTNVLDKDGVSAFATVCEMTSYLYAKKISLVQQLANIFDT